MSEVHSSPTCVSMWTRLVLTDIDVLNEPLEEPVAKHARVHDLGEQNVSVCSYLIMRERVRWFADRGAPSVQGSPFNKVSAFEVDCHCDNIEGVVESSEFLRRRNEKAVCVMWGSPHSKILRARATSVDAFQSSFQVHWTTDGR